MSRCNITSEVTTSFLSQIVNSATMTTKFLRKFLPDLKYLVELVQLLYVLMFSVSLIHLDKIYVDKVCQVNLREWIESHNLTVEVCRNLTG